MVGGSNPSGPTGAAAALIADFDACDTQRAGGRGFLWRHAIAPAAGLLIAALAVFALGRLSREITLDAVLAAMAATGPATLGLAAVLTIISYLILTGYDWLALDHLGYRLPLSTVATAAFTSFTISHTLGMTALTGGSVRYRLYSRVGVAPLDVILIVALCGWTFWLGLVLAAGIGLTLDPAIAATVDVLPKGLNRWAGILLLASATGYVVFAACYRRELKLFGLRMRLPGWRSTAAQLVVGGLDLVAAAGALYVLLPNVGLPPFSGVVVIYALAMIAGALSHAPGGLGVFETVVVVMLPHMPKEDVLAALFMFRVMYTLIPFFVGLALLARTELVALSRRRAAAAGHADAALSRGGEAPGR
ncbi:lysylphosphatidylglycerol synthase domain-containing protein [Glacieibacterium megasporae]|uniref:lysylphosphatidylglycerol synthase domain-containing protein n=1 Tax=Glacieibacterium megasporae TaxID=2835787 RepID=UPI001C1E1A9F|nr:lysylphosphatidylglycerol synthase domain-containing protein [Polymorphobacter megasporae]UAJ09232.1 lysylphosphatidylglycerol synthase domain-containing protein [Polymorphobacter megasporae]